MDQPEHGQPPAMGIIGTGAQLAYQQYQMTGTPNPPGSFGGIQSTGQHTGAQLAYQQYHQHHQQQLHQEIEKVNDFKNHSLPLARIKKIMKADEDVKMISAEAPVVFSKACEMFILELTSCSWNHTEENKRRTLQRNDIAAAITRTDIFDFLVDIVPREDLKDEILASVPQGTMHVGGPAYMAPQIGTTPGMIMDPSIYGQQSNPFMAQPDPSIYSQQSNPYMAQPMWPPGSDQQQPSSDH